jgi:hypothetical protein
MVMIGERRELLAADEPTRRAMAQLLGRVIECETRASNLFERSIRFHVRSVAPCRCV